MCLSYNYEVPRWNLYADFAMLPFEDLSGPLWKRQSCDLFAVSPPSTDSKALQPWQCCWFMLPLNSCCTFIGWSVPPDPWMSPLSFLKQACFFLNDFVSKSPISRGPGVRGAVWGGRGHYPEIGLNGQLGSASQPQKCWQWGVCFPQERNWRRVCPRSNWCSQQKQFTETNNCSPQ